mmetsp:Transcript_7053/g.19147  ORF Transcript_7053/g.19147 Transcript_7053/m.19147 type:complete len:274 (+) Transcript_7053:529-1350(+)
MVTQIVRGRPSGPHLPDAVQLPGQPGQHLPLGTRPPRPPQILRNRRRSAQRHARILLRPHRLAVHQEAPRDREGRARHGLLRPQGGRLRHLPEEARPVVHALHLLLPARPDRLALLGRELLERILRRRRPAILHRPALHVARELRRPPLRRPPLRRHVLPLRKPHRVMVLHRRGMAQLASQVPLRLRRVRIRHLVAVQPQQARHRYLLRLGIGVGTQARYGRVADGTRASRQRSQERRAAAQAGSKAVGSHGREEGGLNAIVLCTRRLHFPQR